MSLESVPAMILAGGLGTRLRPVVSNLPKVLAVVRGRPFITHLLDQLAGSGVRRVIICTGYMADSVQRTLGQSYGDIELTYSAESQPLGTGGALALASKCVQSEQFLAMNGDSYFPVDLNALWSWHRHKEAVATLLLAKATDTARFGRVEVDADGQLKAFKEKTASAGAGFINAGVYCLSREILASIALDRPVSLEREVFPDWIGRGLFAKVGEGPLLDIGTPDSYAQAQTFLGQHIA